MCARFDSHLRLARPLCLEMFEDRCLASVTEALLTPALLSPTLPASFTIPTPGLTRVGPTADSLSGMTAPVGTALASGAGAAATPSISNTSRLTLQSPVVTTGPGLTTGIAVTLPQIIGITNSLSMQVSLGVPASSVSIIGVSATATATFTAGADLTLAVAGSAQLDVGMASIGLPRPSVMPVASVNVTTTGETTSPGAHVKLRAGLAAINNPDVVIRADVGGSEPQGPSGRGTFDVAGPGLAWDGNALFISGAGARVGESGSGALGGDAASSGVRTGVSVVALETAPLLPIDSGADAARDGNHEPVRSDTVPEIAPVNSPLGAFLVLSTSFLTGVPNDLAGAALADHSDDLLNRAAVADVGPQSGANEADDGLSALSPRHESSLAEFLPFDLAALEGDIQALIQQIQQLGDELGSLLARMGLSPWLTAAAVAALAGEIARRRLQGQQSRPQLGACEGATLAWFPDLTGPWSQKEP
jgi:hypothetical protein